MSARGVIGRTMDSYAGREFLTRPVGLDSVKVHILGARGSNMAGSREPGPGTEAVTIPLRGGRSRSYLAAS